MADPVTIGLGLGMLFAWLSGKGGKLSKDPPGSGALPPGLKAGDIKAPDADEQVADVLTDIEPAKVNTSGMIIPYVPPEDAATAIATVSTLTAAGAAVAGVGGPIALAAVGTAVVGGTAGYLITHDVPGVVVGAVNPVGNVFNAGREAGAEIDKLLGSTGDDASGIVAQGTVGVIAVSVFYGALALALSVSIVGAVIYLIVELVEDAERLKYGQPGARDDMLKEMDRIKGLVFDGVRKAYPNTEPGNIVRAAVPFADGWAEQMNRIHYLKWMATAHGIGADDSTHRKWGWDRGYWYGPLGGGYVSPNVHKARTSQHVLTWVPPADRRVINHVYADVLEGKYNETGKITANATAWASFMMQPWGIGKDELSHAQYGLAHGEFEGTLLTDKSFPVLKGDKLYTLKAHVCLYYSGKLASYIDEGGNKGKVLIQYIADVIAKPVAARPPPGKVHLAPVARPSLVTVTAVTGTVSAAAVTNAIKPATS